MKRIAIFGSVEQFETFVNNPDISVIDIKVNSYEQSYSFQGVVFYEDAPQNAKELGTSPNKPQ